MKSLTTPDFWNAYLALPQDLKKQAKKAYQQWKADPSHPSLHFKKVRKNTWSVRITRDYRALALKKGDDYYWFWIGSHDEYDAIIN
ncbi:hypothetical protein [Chroococcus sp. FPU101]|uniref:ParE family toxin-like protein n=1 Tax=Chroococcus sp. FPU101 TaxID=1974212 RepID=UPI001A8D7DB1|nr:hypothetical protein [Chroococcus sp. FPU101]GFE70273.1 hypothetical protein CFPU101_28830 [Chroococcus sp. FPU101]